jgi:hypothetical protein
MSTPPGPSYSGSGWTKTKIQDREWSHVSQIPYYVELLNTAQSIILSGSDNMDVVDCYVLEVSPSPLAMVDWMMAQDQPVGPQFNSMYTLIRVDAYQVGSVRLWIDKRTFRIIKAWIRAEFKGTLRPFPPNGTFAERFEATVRFYGDDDTTIIVLPADAEP